MTNPEQNKTQELPPLIPSWALLSIAGLAFLAFVGALLLGGDIVIIIGAGAVTVIMLFVWMVMFPQEVLDLVKGRSFLYGASGALVIALILFAAGLVYSFVKSRNWTYDFSQRDIYSLDSEVRDVLVRMAQDPTVPSVYILGFYDAATAAERDRITVLFNDMVAASGGKIVGYQFIDPNIEPLRTQGYLNPDGEATQLMTPQLVVAAVEIDPETNLPAPSTTDFETAAVGQNAQFNILNAVLRLGTTGDFRAYFLSVEGGLDIESSNRFGADGFAQDLEDKEWTVEQISPLEITGVSPSVVLDDPTANAEILIIAGGTEPLNEDTMIAIRGYTATGGDLVILGDINTEAPVTTANAENLSNFLWETYGVRLNNDLVIDPSQTLRNNLEIFSNNYGTQSIVTGFTEEDWLIYEGAHSVEISQTPPAGVVITVLAYTSADAYAKANYDFTRDATSDMLAFAEGDVRGPLPLVVAVENTVTGSRLILAGSDSLLVNDYRQFSETSSPEFVLAGIVWASEAQNFASAIAQIIPEPPDADVNAVVNPQQAQGMSLVALCILPVALLLIGAGVWWIQRPRLSN